MKKKDKFYSFSIFLLFVIFFLVLGYFVFNQVSSFYSNNGVEKIRELFSGNSNNAGPNAIDYTKVKLQKTGVITSINCIVFAKDGKALAAGAGGTILKSSNSGKDWQKVKLNTVSNLNGIFFSENGNDIFVAGDNSTIIRSNDFLNSYQPNDIPKNISFFDIYFFNKNEGIVAGNKGSIFITSNAGRTWNQINAGISETLYDINFINDKKGFICGWNGIIISTTNRGNTWQKIAKETEHYLKSIEFIDQEKGLIAGGTGTILRTSDGGKSWSSINSGVNVALNDILVDGKKIYIVGAKGTILLSEDEGMSWQRINTRSFVNLNKIIKDENGDIYIAGVNGTILKL